jgi:hypothetical protein
MAARDALQAPEKIVVDALIGARFVNLLQSDGIFA